MDPTLMANMIAKELLSGPAIWAIIVLSTVAAGIGAYLGKYLQTKGQNWATKEDFAMLQAQLIASTKAVESIKSEISKADWIEKEWKMLQIRKIEELMVATHASEDAVRLYKTENGAKELAEITPILAKPCMIASIYLTDMFQLAERYTQQLSFRAMLMNLVKPKNGESPEETAKRLGPIKREIETHRKDGDAVYSELRAAARKRLMELVAA